MVKLIKLCFACCLIFRATSVGAIITQEEAYEALKNFDAEFWVRYLIPYDELCSSGRKSIVKSVTKYLEPLREREVFKIINADSEEGKTQPLDFTQLDKKLDFSEAKLGEVIFNFYRILQSKVDNRDEEYVTRYKGEFWNITFDEDHYALDMSNEKIDPYFSELIINENRYFFYI